MKRRRYCAFTLSATALFALILFAPVVSPAQGVKEDKARETQATRAQQEVAGAKEAARKPPGFTELLGAFGGFVALLLLLSIAPEKLTDFGKTLLRVDKKDTVAELFGWTSYEKVLGQTDQANLKTAYRVLYNSVEERVARGWRIRRLLDQVRQGLPAPEEKSVSSEELVDLKMNIIRLDLRLVGLEGRRIIWLRFWSVVFGILVSTVLGIDAFLLLDPVTPKTITKLFADARAGVTRHRLDGPRGGDGIILLARLPGRADQRQGEGGEIE